MGSSPWGNLDYTQAMADVENVGDLSALLKGSTFLPKKFELPPEACPDVPHDAFLPELELPVIDLAQDDAFVASEIESAAENWGFFQIVNHGIPMELLERVQSLAFEFFALSTEQKEKAVVEGPFWGYNGRQAHLMWLEALGLRFSPGCENIEELESKIWPEGNQKFRDTLYEFSSVMLPLAARIVELLALSLGLERSAFSGHFSSDYTAAVRFNHYPPCPQPTKTIGLRAHSDPGGISILHQNDVGGLQILKEGKWVAVKPKAEAFVVNLGDMFQVWSNSKYKSVKHRAVVNGSAARLSMPFIYSPQGNAVIEAPQQLVDEEHPVRYKPFTWGEYRAARPNMKIEGLGHLEAFAGLPPATMIPS